jgi:hypothetical protein
MDYLTAKHLALGAVEASFMVRAYTSGPGGVRGFPEARRERMPVALRVIAFACGGVMLAHSGWRLLGEASIDRRSLRQR